MHAAIDDTHFIVRFFQIFSNQGVSHTRETNFPNRLAFLFNFLTSNATSKAPLPFRFV